MSVSNFLFLTKKIAPLIKTSCKNKYLKIVQNRKLQQPESPSTSSSSGLRKGPRLLTAEPSRTTQVRDMGGGGGVGGERMGVARGFGVELFHIFFVDDCTKTSFCQRI